MAKPRYYGATVYNGAMAQRTYWPARYYDAGCMCTPNKTEWRGELDAQFTTDDPFQVSNVPPGCRKPE